MKIPSVIKTAQKFVEDNSPVILTAAGMIGVAVTAVLTHKAATKSYEDIDIKESYGAKVVALTNVEKIQLTWKNYIPPVAAGVTTAGCMFMATKINLGRLTTLGAVYALSDGNFKEYKAKVEEKLGVKETTKLTDDLAKDKVAENPPTIILAPGTGKQVCMEKFTGRYFESNMEELKQAFNRLNYHMVNEDGYAPLSELYSYIGLDSTDISEEIGWNTSELVEPIFSSVLADDGQHVLVVSYNVAPSYGYERNNRL